LTSITASARSRSARAFLVFAFGASSAVASPGSSTASGEVELAHAEEEAVDVRVAPVAERAQQRGGRELLLLVDVDEDDVVDVDGELDPRAAERDDARRDEALAVRVRGLLEHHARGAVELRDDDALGAVDHEGPERREQGQLAEVDLLLDLVLEALLAVGGVLLEHGQDEGRLEGRRVRHVALDALLDGVLGLAQGVALEVQREVLVDVRDGEQVLEDPLEADVLAVVGRGVELEQGFEGARLDVEQVRHVHAVLELSEGDLRDHGNPGLTRERLRGQAKTASSPVPGRHAGDRSEAKGTSVDSVELLRLGRVRHRGTK
jgi:hypothetical protein